MKTKILVLLCAIISSFDSNAAKKPLPLCFSLDTISVNSQGLHLEDVDAWCATGSICVGAGGMGASVSVCVNVRICCAIGCAIWVLDSPITVGGNNVTINSLKDLAEQFVLIDPNINSLNEITELSVTSSSNFEYNGDTFKVKNGKYQIDKNSEDWSLNVETE